jgi:hypothetical protein
MQSTEEWGQKNHFGVEGRPEFHSFVPIDALRFPSGNLRLSVSFIRLSCL